MSLTPRPGPVPQDHITPTSLHDHALSPSSSGGSQPVPHVAHPAGLSVSVVQRTRGEIGHMTLRAPDTRERTSVARHSMPTLCNNALPRAYILAIPTVSGRGWHRQSLA